MSTTPVLSSWIITFHQTGIHTSLIQTWQTMLLMCFFHILPKKGRLNDTYQKLKTVPHLYTYLKEEIPEEFHYRHNRHVMPIFILSRKKDGPLQKTSWELTVVVTMATVTNSLICTPFFLPKDPHSKKALFQNHLKMWIYTLLCVIYWALNQRQTMAHYKQCSIC